MTRIPNSIESICMIELSQSDLWQKGLTIVSLSIDKSIERNMID